MRRECEATVTVDAAAEAVWSVISDVTRVGDWSGECLRCEWVGDRAEPVSKARFRGGNRRGWMRWTRLNEIDVAEPSKEIAWHTVPSGMYRDSTEWRMRLRTVPDGTDLPLSFRILQLSRPMERFLELVQSVGPSASSSRPFPPPVC